MAKLILESRENSFVLNGVEYQKGTLAINHSENGISVGGFYASITDITCNGNHIANMQSLKTWLSTNCFKSGGGSGGNGAVESVTGNLVTGSDTNPVIELKGTPSDIITFDSDGNPVIQPIAIKQLTDIASFPPFANGVFCGTAMNAANKTGLLLFIEFSTTIPKAGTFPSYNTGGTLPVANAVNANHAVNKGQLDSMMIVGEREFTLNGTQTVFNIPHGMGAKPSSFSVTFSDAGNLNFVQSIRTVNATNITFTCLDAPAEGTQTVYWQVFK